MWLECVSLATHLSFALTRVAAAAMTDEARYPVDPPRANARQTSGVGASLRG